MNETPTLPDDTTSTKLLHIVPESMLLKEEGQKFDPGTTMEEDAVPEADIDMKAELKEEDVESCMEEFDPLKAELGECEEEFRVKEDLWGSWETKGSKLKWGNGMPKSQQEVIAELRKKVHSLRSLLHTCRKRAKAQTKAKKTLSEKKVKTIVKDYIVKHHSQVWASFIVDNKGVRPGNWTEMEIIKAIGLRRISKKAYEYMRDNGLCPLPGRSTLQIWVKNHPQWDIDTPFEYERPTESQMPAPEKQQKKTKSSKGDVNICGQCGKNFTKMTLYNQHLAEVHGNEKARKMKCNVCDKWLANPENMKGHQNMHMNITPFKCDYCEKSYRTRKNMGVHRSQAHGEVWRAEVLKQNAKAKAQSYSCQFCDVSFQQHSALEKHIADVHEDPGPGGHKCKFCEKSFGSKGSLNNHMRTHKGAHPYKCYFCPHSLTSKKSLIAHCKDMHPEEWELNKDEIMKKNKSHNHLKIHKDSEEGTDSREGDNVEIAQEKETMTVLVST